MMPLTAQQGFPRMNVLGFMKVAIGNERGGLRGCRNKNAAAAGDFPGVKNRGEQRMLLPEEERISPPWSPGSVGISGDGQGALALDLDDELRKLERGRDRRTQANGQQ